MNKSTMKTFLVVVAGVLAAGALRKNVTAVRRISG